VQPYRSERNTKCNLGLFVRRIPIRGILLAGFVPPNVARKPLKSALDGFRAFDIQFNIKWRNYIYSAAQKANNY